MTASPDPVVRLANLLRKVAPLAELINSDEFSQAERDRLAEMVGDQLYFELCNNLHDLSNWRTRAIRHAKTEKERKALTDGGGVRFGSGEKPEVVPPKVGRPRQ